MTWHDKTVMFKKGHFNAPTPNTDYTNWTVWDWVEYVDKNGTWI